MIDTHETKNNVLSEVAREVKNIEKQVLPHLPFAFQALLASDSGVALAAPQITVPYRWYIDYTGRVYINPEITEYALSVEMREGCLSVPNTLIQRPRFHKVTVKYTTLIGEEKLDKLEGLDAQIAQHELDHLNGKTIADEN